MLTDSELVCLAVAQSLLGFTSETHWLRTHASTYGGMFEYLPQQSGYNMGLRAAVGLVKRVIRTLARSTDFWLDDCWVVDSTPVPCGASRPTVKRSEVAGWAGYGYCAVFAVLLGLKLYLVCTPAGMPILWALADPKIGEREVLSGLRTFCRWTRPLRVIPAGRSRVAPITAGGIRLIGRSVPIATAARTCCSIPKSSRRIGLVARNSA